MNLKKPKFWDYKNQIFMHIYYFQLLFNKIIKINKFKNKTNKFKIKTICVGNIYIGGTGKTSLSIKVKKLLDQKNIKSCFIKNIIKTKLMNKTC